MSNVMAAGRTLHCRRFSTRRDSTCRISRPSPPPRTWRWCCAPRPLRSRRTDTGRKAARTAHAAGPRRGRPAHRAASRRCCRYWPWRTATVDPSTIGSLWDELVGVGEHQVAGVQLHRPLARRVDLVATDIDGLARQFTEILDDHPWTLSVRARVDADAHVHR